MLPGEGVNEEDGSIFPIAVKLEKVQFFDVERKWTSLVPAGANVGDSPGSGWRNGDSGFEVAKAVQKGELRRADM